MTSRLYFPGDVRYEPRSKHKMDLNPTPPVTRVRNPSTMQNHHSEKIMRTVARKPTTNQSYNSIKTTKYVFSGMFCGSQYKIKHSDMVAVDLDGTLAKLFEPYDPRRIGPPVIPMCTKVKKWISQGKKVIILTARLNSKEHTPAQIQYTRKLISAWTKKYVGKALPSTSEKHHLMTEIYDDRAYRVIPNTGKIVK